MSAPTVQKININTTETDTTNIGHAGIKLTNVSGGSDVRIIFDQSTITTTNSYLLEKGKTLELPTGFQTLKAKTDSGTSTLYLIKIAP